MTVITYQSTMTNVAMLCITKKPSICAQTLIGSDSSDLQRPAPGDADRHAIRTRAKLLYHRYSESHNDGYHSCSSIHRQHSIPNRFQTFLSFSLMQLCGSDVVTLLFKSTFFSGHRLCSELDICSQGEWIRGDMDHDWFKKGVHWRRYILRNKDYNM